MFLRSQARDMKTGPDGKPLPGEDEKLQSLGRGRLFSPTQGNPVELSAPGPSGGASSLPTYMPGSGQFGDDEENSDHHTQTGYLPGLYYLRADGEDLALEVETLRGRLRESELRLRETREMLHDAAADRDLLRGELKGLSEIMTKFMAEYERPSTTPKGVASEPTEYDGKEDLAVYLMNFEAMAARFKWSEEDKAYTFKQKMRGDAALFIQNATEETFQAYVTALELGLYETKDHYRQLLQARKQKEDETFQQLSVALQKLADQAYGKQRNPTKVAALRDAFINAISDSVVRTKVRDANPLTMKDAEASAKRLAFNLSLEKPPETEKGKRETKVPVNQVDEKEPGPDVVKQIQDLQTKYEEMRTATANRQRQGGRSNPRGRSLSRSQSRGRRRQPSQRHPVPDDGTPRCYGCGAAGHFARFCPRKTAQAQAQREAQERARGYPLPDRYPQQRQYEPWMEPPLPRVPPQHPFPQQPGNFQRQLAEARGPLLPY